MRAIILSAGQGRRLYPLTRRTPKCLLHLRDDLSVLELQLRTLAASGVARAAVVVGFAASEVECHLSACSALGIEIETIYNPFFETTDNLVSAWLARERMRDDFLLINGDTIFEPALLRRLLEAPRAPAAMAIDRKSEYDADDMKVSLTREGRVRAVSKVLPADAVDGEAIGMIRFQGSGGRALVEGLDQAVRDSAAHGRYYLSVVNENALRGRRIEAVSVEGVWWQEIDCPRDLAQARSLVSESEFEAWEDPGFAPRRAVDLR